MIDLHAHVLPGLDDGPRDPAEALALLTAMEREGVRVVAATPHVRSDYPNTPADIDVVLRAVRAAARDAGLRIRVLAGAEVALDVVDEIPVSALAAYGLGGNPRALLLEFPYRGWPSLIEARLSLLQREGFTVVLAHPERNDRVIDDPELLRGLVDAGALIQLTAASVDGRLGRKVARCSKELIARELSHLLASDAHRPDVRSAGLMDAVRSIDDVRLGRWLTYEVPAAVVAGEGLPVRPGRPSRASRPFWRRR